MSETPQTPPPPTTLTVAGYTLDLTPRVGTTRCAVDDRGGVAPMTLLEARLTDEVAALQEENRSARAHNAKLTLQADLAHGVIQEITETLLAIKGPEAMRHCPPMFYPEAIHYLNAARLRAEMALARLAPTGALGQIGTVEPLLEEWRVVDRTGRWAGESFPSREAAMTRAVMEDQGAPAHGPHRVAQVALLVPPSAEPLEAATPQPALAPEVALALETISEKLLQRYPRASALPWSRPTDPTPVTAETLLRATHLHVRAVPRYWEDATVNGVQDHDGSRIPCRDDVAWVPRIRLADGVVEDWPVGCVARIHYKVCDNGAYFLTNAAGDVLAQWASDYVPARWLCHRAPLDSDYIKLQIDGTGQIQGWSAPPRDPAQWFAPTSDD